jgi:chorismate synthase
VAEAMVCLVLADAVLEKFGGDSLADTLATVDRYRARIAKGPASASASGPDSPSAPDALGAASGTDIGRAPRSDGTAPVESE